MGRTQQEREILLLRIKKFLVWCGFFLISTAFLHGCVHLKEAGRKIWGSSVAHLQKARSSGRSIDCSLPLQECFAKVRGILDSSDATVYIVDQDKRYLVAMNFEGYVDTTEVGIFFTRIKDNLTQVEVASMSPRLTEEVADFIFSQLKEG